MTDDQHGTDDHEGGWKPPSESEKKVLEARRERSDKISKLMSQYLLRGYKMLATVCQVCGTVELEDKQGKLRCVACTEIDNPEVSKDNPAVSQTAAARTLAESSSRSPDSSPSLAISNASAVGGNNGLLPAVVEVAVHDSMDVVIQKLRRATQALAVTENVELSRSYVVLIKECADAIISLRKAEA